MAQLANERLRVEMNTIHGDGRCRPEYSVVQGCVVLPFFKKALSKQQPELGVAQPHGGQIRAATARAGYYIDAQDPIFAAITLCHLHASLVKAFEIAFADGWNGSAFFCRSDEGSEGLQPVKLFILFIRHYSHQFNGWAMPSSVVQNALEAALESSPRFRTSLW